MHSEGVGGCIACGGSAGISGGRTGGGELCAQALSSTASAAGVSQRAVGSGRGMGDHLLDRFVASEFLAPRLLAGQRLGPGGIGAVLRQLAARFERCYALPAGVYQHRRQRPGPDRHATEQS